MNIVDKKKIVSDLMTQSRDIAVFDIDGTLSDLSHRLHYLENGKSEQDWSDFLEACDKDTPIQWTIDLLKSLMTLGYKIYLLTGRSEQVKQKTVDWLKKYEVPYDELRMRKLKDTRQDTIAKFELINGIEDRVWFIVEDRQPVVDMWREKGFNVLQCSAGNDEDVVQAGKQRLLKTQKKMNRPKTPNSYNRKKW